LRHLVETEEEKLVGGVMPQQGIGNLSLLEKRDKVRDGAHARGAAWIAAASLGEISFSDVPQLVEINQVYSPQTANRGIYDERFRVFTKI
jgi:hypothetical protein